MGKMLGHVLNGGHSVAEVRLWSTFVNKQTLEIGLESLLQLEGEEKGGEDKSDVPKSILQELAVHESSKAEVAEAESVISRKGSLVHSSTLSQSSTLSESVMPEAGRSVPQVERDEVRTLSPDPESVQ